MMIEIVIILLVIVFIFAALLTLPKIVRVGGRPIENPRYYLFSGDNGYDYRYLRKMLEDVGIRPLPDSKFITDGHLEYTRGVVNIPSVYFLHIVPVSPDIPYDKNTYTIRTHIQNLHHTDTIMTLTYKDKLMEHMKGSKFIPQSWPMEEFKWSPGVYIMRPSNINVCSGKDIIVVATEQEFEDAKAIYAERAVAYQKFKSGNIRYYHVVVSEYIMNPLLFDGRKMHLRMYVLGTARGCKICRDAEILTAELPYSQCDWQNHRIHDTHFKSTPRDLYYPEDYPGDREALEAQLDELETYLTDNFKFAPFETAELSYQIFGADFMVENDKLKVIEINPKPGMGRKEEHSEKTENFRRRVDKWTFDCIAWMFAPTRYYLFSGDNDYDNRYLKQYLREMGILPAPNSKFIKDGCLELTQEHVDFPPIYFLHVVPFGDTTPRDKHTYTIPAHIQNICDASTTSLTYKDKLANDLGDTSFVPKSWSMEEFKWSPGVYIMRPSNIMACSGKDITVVTTEQEFLDAREFYEKNAEKFQRAKKAHVRYYRVIVSEYIMNPLLFEGRKMHMRVYIIGTSRGCKIFRRAEIMTAALPYVQGDWHNPLIHDTHRKSTPRDIFYPAEYPGDVTALETQFDELERVLSARYSFAPYPKITHAYQIFGADVMVENGSLRLIEINDTPGMTYKDPDSSNVQEHTRELDKWTLENIKWMFD